MVRPRLQLRLRIAVLCLLPAAAVAQVLFQTSDRCVACHNGMRGAHGADHSIGIDWRTSLMANSARDPYFLASVRREAIDHPGAQAAIEDECATCHMPMARYTAKQAGRLGTVFEHLPLSTLTDANRAAADGVSCSICHQIAAQGLGAAETFNGGFNIAGRDANGAHAEFGPWDIDPALARIMRSSTEGFQPQRGDHIRKSELCASCHTLITQALGADGKPDGGSLPEQVPYQEWLHSAYRDERSCQSCHMPAVGVPAPITRVLGANREGVARHEFVGANFLMQRIFAGHHDELGSAALPHEMAAAAERTVRYLQSDAARVTVGAPQLAGGRLATDIDVVNLGGHKLPTAYPARRAWLHLTVRDRSGRRLFESGALNADGSIVGNDNDADATKYEPHYSEIRAPGEVEIYESILRTRGGTLTTGLLAASGYAKDNRLLPRGFDKATAAAEIAVHGAAERDAGFAGGGHRLRLSVDVGAGEAPFTIEAELWYQPIGYRWAHNFDSYEATEPRRFTALYAQSAAAGAVVLAQATAVTR
jgi:hypothetical protein